MGADGFRHWGCGRRVVGVRYIGMDAMYYPHVRVSADVLRWAIDYSRREEVLRRHYPQLEGWMDGSVWPTVNELRAFARDARVAEYILRSDAVPARELGLPDMRTVGNEGVATPSPDLFDTVHLCLIRQDWLGEYARNSGWVPVEFVGAASIKDDPGDVADQMRAMLLIDDARRASRTRGDFRRALMRRAEDCGVLVMVNGIVGNDTHRRLDPAEFRGFASHDEYAPMVFVNGSDSLGAQVFTLVHEIAHLWLGESALSDSDATVAVSHPSEVWCNAVAARALVPADALAASLRGGLPLDQVDDLSLEYKVSRQVITRRFFDEGLIDRAAFESELHAAPHVEPNALLDPDGSGTPSFYRVTLNRVGRRLARPLYWSTKAGHTNYREAFRLLGISSGEQLNRLGKEMGLS